MPEFQPPVERRRHRRWWWLAGGTAALVILWCVRGPLLGPVIAQQAAQVLSRVLEGPVVVQQAGGGWLADAELVGVASLHELPGTVRHLSIEQVAIRHDLGLLRGDLSALRSIAARGVHIDLESQSSQGESSATWTPVFDMLPEPLPRIDISGSMRLKAAGEQLLIPDLTICGGGKELDLIAHGLVIHDLAPIDLALRVARRTRDSLALVEPITLHGVTVEGLEVTLGQALQQVVIQVAAWGGTATVTVKPQAIAAQMKALDLSALPESATAHLGSFWLPLAGRMDAALTAKRDAKAVGGWAVAVDFSVSGGQSGNRIIDAFRGSAELTAEGVRIPELSIDVAGGVHAQIDDLDIIRLGDQWLPRRGRATLVVDDLRPWLRQAGLGDELLPLQPIRLSAILMLDAGTVTVERLRIITPGLTIDGTATLAALIGRITACDLIVHTDLTQLAGNVPSLTGLSGQVMGKVRYHGRVPTSIASLLQGDGTVQVEGSSLAWKDRMVQRLALSAHTDRGQVHIDQTAIQIGEAAFSGSGTIAPRGLGIVGTISTATAVWRGVQVALAHPVAIQADRHSVNSENWSLVIPGGTASGSLRVGSTVNIAAAIADLDVMAVGKAVGREDVAGHVSAALTVVGDWECPTVHVELHGRDLSVAGQTVELGVVADQDGRGIHLRRCVVDIAELLQIRGAGTWNMALGRSGLSLRDGKSDIALTATVQDLSRLGQGLITKGQAELELHADSDQVCVGTMRIHGIQLHHADADKPGRKISAPMPVDIEAQMNIGDNGGNATIACRLGGVSVLSGTVSSPGRWFWSERESRPLVGHITVDHCPLDGLLGAVPGLLQGTGRLSGSMAIAGSVSAPAFTGDVTISDGTFKISNTIPSITGVQGEISLRKGRMLLTKLTGDLGFSPARLDGSIDFIGPQAPVLDLHLTGDNLLLVQNSDLRLRANADLQLKGPWQALSASGVTTITSALYSRRIELVGGKSGGGPKDDHLQLFLLRDPPLSQMHFDVHMRTSTKKSDEGLRIANNVIRASATVDVHLGGTGAVPQPDGSIIVREALVTLPFSTVIVERGEVVFPKNDPFSPTIAAAGRAQVRQYAVTVNIQGAVRDPDVHAACVGLAERDAILLLTAGATTDELENPDGQMAALGRVGTWIGRETWRKIRGPGDPDAGPTPLDNLTMEFGRAVSDTGRETIEAEMRLNDPGKALGYFLYGERDRYDDYNMGCILRWRFGGSE